jgi:hypothetical protein
MGLSLLLLATPPIVVGHFLIGGWDSNSLVAEGDAPISEGEVVLAERLHLSPADRETGPKVGH